MYYNFRCRDRLRLAKQTPDHEGPFHPIYSKFHIRRSLRRICHYYHHPSHPHRRFEEVIDVIAIPSVMALQSRSQTVWEDNSPESLFILASKPAKSCGTTFKRCKIYEFINNPIKGNFSNGAYFEMLGLIPIVKLVLSEHFILNCNLLNK